MYRNPLLFGVAVRNKAQDGETRGVRGSNGGLFHMVWPTPYVWSLIMAVRGHLLINAVGLVVATFGNLDQL